jgi:hypothetical protein
MAGDRRRKNPQFIFFNPRHDHKVLLAVSILMGIPNLYPFMDGLFHRKYLELDDLGVPPFQETNTNMWVSENGVTK